MVAPSTGYEIKIGSTPQSRPSYEILRAWGKRDHERLSSNYTEWYMFTSCDNVAVSDFLKKIWYLWETATTPYDLCNCAAAGVIHSRYVLDLSQPGTWKLTVWRIV